VGTKLFQIGILALAFVGLTTAYPISAAAAKSTSHPCTVIIGNFTTMMNGVTVPPYGMANDGNGPYTNGLDGVSCSVGGPNDTNLTLNLPSNRTTRTIFGNFTELATSIVPSWTWTGSMKGNYLTVLGITSITSTPGYLPAHVLFQNNSYSLNWCGSVIVAGTPCAAQGIGSDLVFVSRAPLQPSGFSWTVTATQDQINASAGSDHAALYSYSSATELALYYMPFQLTVTCPTCPGP
jgi:hypothetical protein